jgi:hypothetical protein
MLHKCLVDPHNVVLLLGINKVGVDCFNAVFRYGRIEFLKSLKYILCIGLRAGKNKVIVRVTVFSDGGCFSTARNTGPNFYVNGVLKEEIFTAVMKEDVVVHNEIFTNDIAGGLRVWEGTKTNYGP